MIDSSWSWASSRNLIRKNPVHGEDEAKLVIAETFGSHTENGDMMEWTGEAECEDTGWYKLLIQFMCVFLNRMDISIIFVGLFSEFSKYIFIP